MWWIYDRKKDDSWVIWADTTRFPWNCDRRDCYWDVSSCYQGYWEDKWGLVGTRGGRGLIK